MKITRSFLVIVSIMVALMVVVGCNNEEPTPTSAPPATVEQPGEPTPEAIGTPGMEPGDVVWNQIQDRGSIIVGTSLDYPPFSYYDDNFAVDGFDIALINAIANKMGLTVEIVDYTFDGLINTLTLNQVDIAIAGISITPERRTLVDFSNAYFISEAAVLTGNDNSIVINHPEELAGYRIGVLKGSIYQEWLEDNLTSDAFQNDTSIIGYDLLDLAVENLSDGYLDFVVMDLPPAEILSQSEDFVIAGRGARQRYGIALPLNEPTLRNAINQALVDLQNEGAILNLVEEYMDLEMNEVLPVPTPTPAPPVPTRVPPTCVDGMAWVADVTFGDNNMSAPPELQPNQGFQKVWRLRNTGSCPWNNSYRLVYTGGNNPASRMSGNPVAVSKTIAPGAEFDFTANLIAPATPGTYQGFWELYNDNNIPFGQRIWVGIRIPGQLTPIPQPTQTPSPGIEFAVSRNVIQAGESALLVWETGNVRAVYLYEQTEGDEWQNFGVPGNGSREVKPLATTIYELRVIRNDGATELRNVVITVNGGFVGLRWLVNKMNSPAGSFDTLIPGSEITLFFNANGTVNGSGGCNQYGGTYELIGSRLTFNITSQGEASCGTEIDNQEVLFLQKLAEIKNYIHQSGWLYLTGTNGQREISLRPD